MATEFSFPANPVIGQTFLLPDGNTVQWNGYTWISMTDSPIVYPLPIVMGGTGASSASGARLNLGINNGAGQLIISPDGNVSVPGLVWASEPGLGWYRTGPNVIRLASSGAQQLSYGMSDPSLMYMGMTPRVAGQSQINLGSSPAGTTDSRSMVLQALTTGSYIGEVLTGAATASVLNLGFAGGIQFPDGTVTKPGIQFNAEGTLGWYRGAAREIRIAASGLQVFNFSANGGLTTALTLYPRTGGGSSNIGIKLNPAGDADASQLNLMEDAGGAYITSYGATGGASRRPMTYQASSHSFDAPVLHSDGTITAPGLAWNSEPGLGWFRGGTSAMSMAVQGSNVISYGFSDPALTYMGMQPRAAGRSQINMSNAVAGAANANLLTFQQQADGVASITTNAVGSAVRGNLRLDAPFVNTTAALAVGADLSVTNPAGWPALNIVKPASGTGCVLQGYTGSKVRWGMSLGDGVAESGADVGSDFRIARYNDAGTWLSEPFVINRKTGVVTIAGSSGTFGAGIGQISVVGGGGTTGEVDISAASSAAAGQPGWPNIAGGMIAIRGNTNGSYNAGAISCYSGLGGVGAMLFAGQTTWNTPSDERLKNIVGEVTNGLEAVLAMRPVRFHYLTDEPDFPVRVGLTAQSVLLHVPEAVNEVPDLEADGDSPTPRLAATTHLSIRLVEVIPALVNAIKTLNDRLTALETA